MLVPECQGQNLALTVLYVPAMAYVGATRIQTTFRAKAARIQVLLWPPSRYRIPRKPPCVPAKWLAVGTKPRARRCYYDHLSDSFPGCGVFLWARYPCYRDGFVLQAHRLLYHST